MNKDRLMKNMMSLQRYLFSLIISVFVGSTLFASVNSKYSMRRCMLLPISDKVQGAIAYKVFEEIERSLKFGDWCYYKSNSGILNILQNYQPNLERHLSNPEVIRTIANKTRSGSIIHIIMQTVVNGVDLEIKIHADNGEDVYFKEKLRIDKVDISLISQTIINWLSVYEKTIPYDGRIIGVLGNQFTVDVGRASKVFVGNNLRVIRPLKRKKHPLLNEIVEWESMPIGDGTIVNISEFQSSASIKNYTNRKQLQPGDWVVMQQRLKEDVKNKVDYPDLKGYEFGQLGRASVGLKLGSGSDATNVSNANKKIDGLIYGVYGSIEGWATRNIWFGADIEKNIGDYSTAEGITNLSETGVSQTIVKFKVGYKYLPMGFFYGPQVDAYLGYGSYTYDLDTSASDGFGNHKISGILIGLRGSVPFHRVIRGFLKLDFLMGADYEEETNVFGSSATSATSYQIEAGANYIYSPQMTIDGSAEITSNKAQFSGNNEFHFKEVALKVGTTFSF